MQAQAKLTSKGQITVPVEVRRLMGVHPGDQLVFESDGEAIRVRPLTKGSRFEKYRGIGNPGIASGRRAITRWLRELRGR
jgi:antitoxin PrlF